MGVEHRGGGAPNREPTPSEAKRPEQNQPTLAVGEGLGGVPPPQGEQQAQGGGIDKPALHPPTELPLPFEANRPRREPQTGDLDPEVERLMRAYAESVADGDPKKAERLFKRYLRNPSLMQTFKEFHLHGTPTLTYVAPDVSKVVKEPKKQE